MSVQAWFELSGLLCVVINFPGSKAYPVSVPDMTTKEKRRYTEWKNR